MDTRSHFVDAPVARTAYRPAFAAGLFYFVASLLAVAALFFAVALAERISPRHLETEADQPAVGP